MQAAGAAQQRVAAAEAELRQTGAEVASVTARRDELQSARRAAWRTEEDAKQCVLLDPVCTRLECSA